MMSLLRKRCVSLISNSWSSKRMKRRKYMPWSSKFSKTISFTNKSSTSTVSKIKSNRRLKRDLRSYNFNTLFIKRMHRSSLVQWSPWTWTRLMIMKMMRNSYWMQKLTCKIQILITSLKMKRITIKNRWKRRVKKKKMNRLSNSSTLDIMTMTISLTLTLGPKRLRVVKATHKMPLIWYKLQQHLIHTGHLLLSLINK